MAHKLIINEVDCYIGNSFRINHYATHRAVQHQIMLIDDDNHEWYLKRRNRVADIDRGERIVHSASVPKEIKNILLQAIDIQAHMRSEYCDSIEELNEAVEYNKPFKEQLKNKIRDIYKIETLGLDFDTFYYHIKY